MPNCEHVKDKAVALLKDWAGTHPDAVVRDELFAFAMRLEAARLW